MDCRYCVYYSREKSEKHCAKWCKELKKRYCTKGFCNKLQICVWGLESACEKAEKRK